MFAEQLILVVTAHPVLWVLAITMPVLWLGRWRIIAYYKALTVARHYLRTGGSIEPVQLPAGTVAIDHYLDGTGTKVPLLIFQPGRNAPAPMVILFHGASPLGEEHPALTAIARALSATGYVVSIPRIPNLKRLIINNDNLTAIRSAYEQLRLRTDLHNGRIGVMGISFAGSLLLKALTTIPARQRPAAVLSYGSYCDLETSLRFIVTGNANFGRTKYTVEPDPWGQVIFFYNFVAHIPGNFDRAIVASLLEQYVGGAENEVRGQLSSLKPAERALMTLLLGGPSPALVELMEAVLANAKATLAELSPSTFYLRIDFPFSLLHGRDDTSIPYTEALQMKSLLPNLAQLHITGLLSHKDLKWGRNVLPLVKTVEGLVRAYADFIYQLVR